MAQNISCHFHSMILGIVIQHTFMYVMVNSPMYISPWTKGSQITDNIFESDFINENWFISTISTSLFLWAWLTRCHHWFKQWFGVEQAIIHYLNQKLISATHAALGTDEVYSMKERYFVFFFSKQKRICILCDIQHPQTRSKWYQIWLWNSLFHFT